MRHHLLVAETKAAGRSHIDKMCLQWNMLAPLQESASGRILVRLPSGRTDLITIITNEEDATSYLVNGRIFAQCNSFAVDPLLFYARAHNRSTMDDYDPQTLCWHWATEDTYQGVIADERPIWPTIWVGMEAAKRARRRGGQGIRKRSAII